MSEMIIREENVLSDAAAQLYVDGMRRLCLQVSREWTSLREYWGLFRHVMSTDLYHPADAPVMSRLQLEGKMNGLCSLARHLAEQIMLAESGEVPDPDKLLELAYEIALQEH